jgi:hypothetical protein
MRFRYSQSCSPCSTAPLCRPTTNNPQNGRQPPQRTILSSQTHQEAGSQGWSTKKIIEMSLRNLRPAAGESSASTSHPSSSTSRNSGRRNREDRDSGSSSTSKRRRVPESVTINACLNCKKARAKVSSLRSPKHSVPHRRTILRIFLGWAHNGYLD